jgi:hypothetical protein
MFLLGFALFFAACREDKPAPPATPLPVQSPAVSAQPTAKAPTKMVTPPADRASADTWLAVRKDGVELALIELRSGKAPKLTAENGSANLTALRERLAKVGGPNGIGLDMHEPPPSGTGRDPLGTRIIKYDDPLYRHALKEQLEPEFDVKEVPRLFDPMPPAKFTKLNVSHSGQKMGSIDFGSTPPKLSGVADSGDGLGMKNRWDSITEKPEVQVRYHYDKDGVETLVDARAKPGDASYAQTVALNLIVMHDYRKQYAYELEFEN